MIIITLRCWNFLNQSGFGSEHDQNLGAWHGMNNRNHVEFIQLLIPPNNKLLRTSAIPQQLIGL